MITHPSYRAALANVQQEYLMNATRVHSLHWQGIDISKKPEMATYEARHVSFAVDMNDYGSYHGCDMETLVDDIKPNMPWAENHFRERVCGQPINPGVEWANWPYGKSAARFLDSNGQFNHNYMERYWPKRAGLLRATERAADYVDIEVGEPDLSFTPPAPIPPTHKGIRYDYGDLNDVCELLAHDPYTRQAYLPVWFPEDTGGGDKRAPCTLGYHFMMRNNRLDIAYYIRSCDMLRHFRDDIYLTHRLAQWVIQRAFNLVNEGHNDYEKLKQQWDDVEPGKFVMHISSLHLFVNDWRNLFPHIEPPR